MRAMAVLAALAAAALFSACGDDGDDGRVSIGIRYSRYLAESVTVHAGDPVTFALRNDDPIEHEWIVGAADVHERHRKGTEPHHDSVPTEVTIPALTTRTTTVTFETPGDYEYVCHLPGHEAYGMKGTVHVLPTG